MDRNVRKQAAPEGDGASPPSEAWLFAQALLGKPIPSASAAEAEARRQRERLEWLASISDRHALELRRLQSAETEARRDRERLEWLAQFSTEHERKLRTLLREEAESREGWRRAEQFAEQLLEGSWDPSKHPKGAFPQNRGWWSPTGGASSEGPAATPSASFHTAAIHPNQATAQLAAFAGAPSATWPATGPTSSWLPNVGSGAGAAAGAAAGIGAGAFLGGLRNGSLGAFWGRVPGVQAMPQIWVYELEKRVRAGKLSREDAIGIFNTAVLGAEAQGFKPTGGTMSAVHKSATDFLGKAEAVYFARKKEAQGWATQPGGYQQSGGRVFPTKRNSGLDGYALRQEQEKFFERGLSEGKDPSYLRGQAAEAGSTRAGGNRRPADRLLDPEAEAALQRAIKKTQK